MAENPTGTIISWNFTNWTTIVLMALVFFGLIGLGQKWYQSRSGAAA